MSLLLLSACQVEYADVTHEDEDDEIVPAGPAPPDSIILSRGDMVEPALPWDGITLTEQVCAFSESMSISGADMRDIELLSMELLGGYGGSPSDLPGGQVRVIGLYGTSGSYPSTSNQATSAAEPLGSDGSWGASWTSSALNGLNFCSPDCYYSGFHLEMRIPWEDEQTPGADCDDFLEMELSFTWYDLAEGEIAL